MRKSLSALLFAICASLLALPSLSSYAADGKPAGGKGSIHSLYACFKPTGGTLKEVCASYQLNWKMWTLMGEPVGDYNISWKLTSLQLMDPKRKQVVNYSAATVPKELSKGVRAIELYIDATANVNGPMASHRFNSGTGVRADGGVSMNTPGSPNWNSLFMQGPAACDLLLIKASKTFLGEKEAKAIFVRGFELTNMQLCAESGVSELTTLESEIDELCGKPGADKSFAFCPVQKPAPAKAETANAPANSIDDAFAALEKKNGTDKPKKAASGVADAFSQMESDRAEQERKRIADAKARQEREDRERMLRERHDEALTFCRAAMKSETGCLEDLCHEEPGKTICTEQRENEDRTPCDCSPKGHCGCIRFPTYTCIAHGDNPAYREWEVCKARAAGQCKHDSSLPPTMEACVSQRETKAVRK